MSPSMSPPFIWGIIVFVITALPAMTPFSLNFMYEFSDVCGSLLR